MRKGTEMGWIVRRDAAPGPVARERSDGQSARRESTHNCEEKTVKRTNVVVERARKRVLAHLDGRGVEAFPMPMGIVRVLLIVLEDADGPEEAARWRTRIVKACRRPLSVRQTQEGGPRWVR
jgi:hypothetical protein